MVDCKACKNTYCPYAKTDRGFVVSCSGYKVAQKSQTNADRIRAMSDEELAAWLVEDDCHDCPEYERLSDNPLLRYERCDGKCKEHCLDWLRQHVKGGEDDG